MKATMKKILLAMTIMCAAAAQALAQKTCVIASAENHVPIREALVHTNTNHWARTDYRGYFNMRYSFDSATVSKPGFVKATIYLEQLPDTVFLLPEAHQIGEVTVWGKDQEHVRQIEQNIQDKVNSIPTSPGGIGFNAFGWMDKQGRRDRKHLKEAKKIFREMDRKDPIVAAYEKATGKVYGEKADYELSLEAQDSMEAKKPEPVSLGKIAAGALGTALTVGEIFMDSKQDDLQKPDVFKKKEE